MKTQITYPEFHARVCFIMRKIGYKLSSQFFTLFFNSTLPLLEKMELLKTMPSTEEEILLVIEILASDNHIKKFEQRDREWSAFLNNESIEEVSRGYFKNFKAIA